MTPVVTRTRLVLAALAATLALPATASAGLASAVTRAAEVPPGVVVTVPAPARFDLVGLRWRGPGSLELRARSTDGTWGAWRDAAPEDEDRPDHASAEGRDGVGWQLGNPWWVGPSDRLQVRARGRVSFVRATFVRSPEVRVPLREQSATTAPPIVPRVGWNADEGLVREPPSYATRVRYAVVHHTAGANDYTRSEAAAIVRGIQVFHVRSNGWNDIGYNFLVDRFGTIYEGRAGGLDRNVIGAHAQGFNTGSVGVALLGTYTSARPSVPAEKALAALLAWRLDLAYVDPLATLTVASTGNDRFPAGVPVLLRTVSGHRDTGFTVCPGDALYARLGTLAAETAATGPPNLYDPTVIGVLGGPVTFRARLSEPLPWTVVVANAAGAEVARGTGSSAAVDWTWDATVAPPGEYRWTISAGTGARAARPAMGAVGAAVEAPPLEIADTGATPEVINPNGLGAAPQTTIGYRLTAPATVAVSVLDEAGAELLVLEPARWRRAAEHVLTFDGAGLPDGRYAIRLVARAADGTEAEARVAVAITRTLGAASLAPPIFSPNGDGRRERLSLTFALAAEADVVVRVTRDGRWVATPFRGRLGAGARTIRWDGTRASGRLRDGDYTATIDVTDAIGTVSVALPFASDATAPRLRLVSRIPPTVAISEPGTIRMRVNGAVRVLRVEAPGRVVIPGVREVRTIVARARDAVGNLSAPLSRR